MTKKKDVGRDKPVKTDRTTDTEDTCRCKEVSKKSLPELLKIMISDLAFWKRAKRN